MKRNTILRVKVGSHAFGVNRPESDNDFIEVYVEPTSDFFRSSTKQSKHTLHVIEGKEDTQYHEVGKFIEMSLKCNPQILVTYRSPIVYITEEGEELRNLLKYTWSPNRLYNAVEGFIKSKKNRKVTIEQHMKWYYVALCKIGIAYQLLASPNNTFTTDFKNSHFPQVQDIYKLIMRVRFDKTFVPNVSNNEEAESFLQEVEQDIADRLWHLRIWRDYYIASNLHTEMPNIPKFDEYLIKLRKKFF